MAIPRRTKTRPDPTMHEIAGIGYAFAARRIALHLTQQTLADLAGVSRSSIQSLERGNGSIKFGTVMEIANVLGLQITVAVTSE